MFGRSFFNDEVDNHSDGTEKPFLPWNQNKGQMATTENVEGEEKVGDDVEVDWFGEDEFEGPVEIVSDPLRDEEAEVTNVWPDGLRQRRGAQPLDLPEDEPAPGPIRGRTDPIGGLDINDEGFFVGGEERATEAIAESSTKLFEGIAKAGEFAGPIGAAVVAGYGIYKFADWAGGGSSNRDQKYTDRYNAVRKLRDDLPKLKEQLNDMRAMIDARQTKMEAYKAYGVEWSDLKLIGSKWI
jgi:hypothetical protein